MIYPGEGYIIQDTPTFGEDSENFVIEPGTEKNEYLIGLGENIPDKKATYKLKLAVSLKTVNSAAAAVTVERDFTVKVVSTQPKVAVKQTKKVNLFYGAGDTGGNGTLTITSPAAIEDVTWIGDADATDFSVKYNNDDTCVISLQKGAEIEKLNKKGTLSIRLAGYKEPVEKKLSIGTEKKAPKVTLDAKSGTI
jgi:hypothetical protein